MLWALGAASGAIDLISSLTKSGGSNQSTGFNIGQTNNGSGGGSNASATGLIGGSGQSGALSPDTYAALIAAQNQTAGQSQGSNAQGRSGALQDLFNLIDGNGDGSLSKSEFESALGAGGTNTAAADSVFGKLDSNGDGSVSINELASALKSGHHRQQAQGAGDADGDGDGSSSQAAGAGSSQGTTTSTTTNSDGSTTTTISYADGSKVTMTSAPVSSSSSGSGGNSAASTYSLIERMIQREASMLSKSAGQTISTSV